MPAACPQDAPQEVIAAERRAYPRRNDRSAWPGIDIPHFCNEDGHELVEAEKTDDGHRFLIRKR
jgi:hypothetical protein